MVQVTIAEADRIVEDSLTRTTMVPLYVPQYNECEWCGSDVDRWSINSRGYATCPECKQVN